MNKEIVKFFTRFFCRQVFTSPKHLGVICFVVVFISLGILFYGYINSFKQIYINDLKGLYPEIFLEHQGRRVKEWMPGIGLEKEIFEVSRSIVFRFHPDAKDTMLFDVGVRAAGPGRLARIVNDEVADGESADEIWVNEALGQKLEGSKGFDGRGIYLKGRAGEYEYVKVNRFSVLGQRDKDWLVLPAGLADNLKMLFNIAAIYPDNSADPDSIKSTFENRGFRVFQWLDRLPFLNLAVYKVGLQLYLAFMVSTLWLTVFLLLSVFHDMLTEFKRVMRFSIIYGLNEFVIFLVFAVFTVLYAALCYSVSWITLRIVTSLGDEFFPLIGSIPLNKLIFYSFILLLPLLAILTGWSLKRVYSEGYVGAEQ